MTSAPLHRLGSAMTCHRFHRLRLVAATHRRASPEWSGPQTKAVTSHRTPKTPTRPKRIPPLTVVLIKKLEQMRRRELADLAADCGTHLGAVAPVHPTPYPRVTF